MLVSFHAQCHYVLKREKKNLQTKKTPSQILRFKFKESKIMGISKLLFLKAIYACKHYKHISTVPVF